MTDALDDLFPAPQRMTLMGRELAILPAALPEIAAAARVIDGWQRLVATERPLAALAVEMSAMAPDLATLTGVPEAEILACPARDMPALVGVVNALVAANAGFFARRVLPGLAAGVPAVRAAMARTDGPTSSPDSSGGGTAGAT